MQTRSQHHPASIRPTAPVILKQFRAAGCFSRRASPSTASWTSLCPIDTFPAGETRLAFYKNPSQNPWDGQTDNVACYVRRETSSEFKVFAINCAHLGCPVRWFPQSELFMCPCHGGVYYGDGSRAAGPPPRGLFEYPWKVQEGKLLIDGGQMSTLATTASVRKESSQCTG